MKTSSQTTKASPSRTGLLLKILFFLLATSWLAAPFVHGQHYGHLYYISDYEGVGQPLSWLFRSSDLAASIVLIIMVIYHQLWRRDRLIYWLVLAYAIFSALDPFFPLDCSHLVANHCVVRNNYEMFAHYAESIATPLVGIILIATDLVRQYRQRLVNGIFLALQIIIGGLFVINAFSNQVMVVLEYIYEVAITLWIIYFFEAYEPEVTKPASKLYGWYRNGLALWVGLAGALEIFVAAAHLHLYGHSFALYFGQSSAWLAQQGVIIGVLLLYLARQIQRGERRAAYVLIALASYELFTYSLVSPHRPLAIIYELLLIAVFLSRKTFDRNTGRISLHRRVSDLLTLLATVAVTVIAVIILLSAVGRFGRVENILGGGAHYAGRFYHHSRQIVHHSDRLGDTLIVLVSATVVVSAWALFRPQRLVELASHDERDKASELVEKFSASSEDYFKLWPHDKTYFFAEDGNGFIAYKVVRGTAFALADPIAEGVSARQKLLTEFASYCHEKGWTICLLPVEAKHKKLYEDIDFKLVPMGASAVVNIAEFNAATRRDKWWRWKLNRATKAGYTYEFSQPPHSRALLAATKKVSDAWLGQGGRREQGFALGYYDDYYLDQCRLHYVRNGSGKIIAFANELPVFIEHQTTVDLIRYLPSEDTAMPYLLASIIEQSANEGRFTTLDLGFVPLAQIDNNAAKLARAAGKIRFSAVGLEQFKNKFKPDWHPNYLAYSGDILDLAGLALKLEAALKKD